MFLSYSFNIGRHGLTLTHIISIISLSRLAPKILVMSIIQQPLGYKDWDLKCAFVLFVTYVTCHCLEI